MDKYLGKMLDNRYEILEIIGVGGMAVVYKAKCHRLNRLVALKILKDDYAQDADFKRRFHAESQAVAMLSHPNIVAVYDVSRSGIVEYIVMELIDGITLKQYMSKKGNLSWREVLHFSTQITKALIHAHSRGIIHRDIKPHNIMILRDGSVKVADFGIARFSGKQQNTLTQEALGSVHYISPEQARGSHIDARSDIYSVGVVMYEMLTMRLPYEGDSPVSVAIQHINSIPLTPREIDPQIPEALETITMKAMSAGLSKRYASAEALLQDLEEFRKNPSISFDYDIAELMTRDEDEPTKKLPGVNAQRQNGGRQRPVEMNDAEDEAYRARQRNKSLTMITGLSFVLIFIVAMAYMVITFLGNLTGGGGPTINVDDDAIEIPDLIDKVYNGINELYPDITIVLNPEGKNSDVIEQGRILEQDPVKGQIRKKGTTVTVTVSTGAREFPMPFVNGMEYRQAQNFLIGKEYNLRYNPEIIWETSDTIVKDHVIRTEPAANELVREGAYVTLYVSKGVEPVFAKMTQLVGMTREDAERELERLDLLPKVTEMESDKPTGEVIWQDVPADTEVETRTEVQLQVSLGPTVTPEPEPTTTGGEEDPTLPSPSPDVGDDVPVNGTTPDPTPTPEPQNQEVTSAITVTLPSTAGTTNVVIRKNGIIVKSEDVNNSEGQKVYSITGMPSDSIDVYFDDDLKFTRPLVQ